MILTEHGDGTRQPDPPTYHSGVLCLDGVEVSTSGGHYLAIDMPASPYPLAGNARAVAEDVARLGGFGVIAHPSSPKAELEWRDWSVVSDGIEWLSADSEWRDEPLYRLGNALLHYFFRPAETLTSLLDRPERDLLRWDGMTQRRRIVALAGADAHGALALPGGADARLGGLDLPSYEQTFRSFAIRVQLGEPWTGNPGRDGAGLMAALRAGRVYTAIDGLAPVGRFEFSAQDRQSSVTVGDELAPVGPVDLAVRVDLPPGGEIRLFQDGALVRRSGRPALRYRAPARDAVFRAEVTLATAPGAPAVPWILTNPIYIGRRDSGRGSGDGGGEVVQTTRLFSNEADADGWIVEHEAESLAAVGSTPAVEGRELAFRYALSGEPDNTPFAALVRADVGALGDHDQLRLRIRGDREQRISVQVRVHGEAGEERWQRSLYVSEDMREVTVAFQDLVPLGQAGPEPPDLSDVQALLFVVDTVNTPPATSGVVWLDEVRLERWRAW